jgi:hypothetical protein
MQATAAAERAEKKQRLLEAKTEAATVRMEALEHRSKQQAAALEDSRRRRRGVEGAWQEAEERADTLARRLVAAEAAAADARARAARATATRSALAAEADGARDEARDLSRQVCCPVLYCLPCMLHVTAAPAAAAAPYSSAGAAPCDA